MKHSLINPSQIQECGIHVYDDPISNLQFGINGNEMFIPFNTMGTIVHFESRAPTDWESHNLPINYSCLTRLVDRSEKGSCLLFACDLLVALRWNISHTCEILQASILHSCHFSQHTPVVPSFFLRWDQIIYCTLTSTRFEFLAFCRLVCVSI